LRDRYSETMDRGRPLPAVNTLDVERQAAWKLWSLPLMGQSENLAFWGFRLL
jgi:hypothetical protein